MAVLGWRRAGKLVLLEQRLRHQKVAEDFQIRTKGLNNVWMVAFRNNDRFFQQTVCAAQRNIKTTKTENKTKGTTMSDILKCPFCQQELKKHLGGDMPEVWCCDNEKCKLQTIGGDIELWQELITTRKALNIAMDSLKSMNEIIKNYEYGNGLYYALDGHDTMLVAEDVEKAICLINEITGNNKM